MKEGYYKHYDPELGFEYRPIVEERILEKTWPISGSENVKAMFRNQLTVIRGKWIDIRVTGISIDESFPLEGRKSLVGLTFPTIFSTEQVEAQIRESFLLPFESRLAYIEDIIRVLRTSKRDEEAELFADLQTHPLDMYIFRKGDYEIVN